MRFGYRRRRGEGEHLLALGQALSDLNERHDTQKNNNRSKYTKHFQVRVHHQRSLSALARDYVFYYTTIPTPRPLPSPHLRNISIPPLLILLPLQKLLLNQPINIPLNPAHLQRSPTPRRLNGLRYQLRMTNPLPGLQNPHDSSLRLIIAISGNTLVRLLVLGGGLFELHGVDFDAVLRVVEGGV